MKDFPARALFAAIQLLPKNKAGWAARRMFYRRVYLKTHHWKRTRFSGAGICWMCKTPGQMMHSHHLNYDNLWHERRGIDIVRVHPGICHNRADAMRRDKRWS